MAPAAGASVVDLKGSVSGRLPAASTPHARSSVKRSHGCDCSTSGSSSQVLPGIVGTGQLGVDATCPITTPGFPGGAGVLIFLSLPAGVPRHPRTVLPRWKYDEEFHRDLSLQPDIGWGRKPAQPKTEKACSQLFIVLATFSFLSTGLSEN